MNKLVISTVATALVLSFAVSAEAAGNKQKMSADVQASCKAQAAEILCNPLLEKTQLRQ